MKSRVGGYSDGVVREGEVAGSYRAAVASAVASTQAFIADPSQAQLQIAARSLQDALNQGLFLLGVPKEDVAKLASSIVANRGSQVLSPKSLRARPLPAPSPTLRGCNSSARVDSCGDRLTTNLPRPIGAPVREGK